MMKYAFGKYDKYINTDSYWFDEVPHHWMSGRVKDFIDTNTVTKIPKGINDNDLIEFVPMTNVNDKLGKIKQFNFVPLKEVSSGYTKFRNKDVIFAKITPCMENGNCAIVNGLTYDICFGSTEFMVFRAFRKLSEKYLHYFLHNELFRRNAEPFMKGTAGQKRISSQYMATHYFALPPIQEQKSIYNYLDTKTAQIDQKVDLLTQKAVKYSNLKQSLISEIVTHGLDKTVAMKDSGVEWIGKVPEHWEVKRFKELGFLYNGLSGKKGDDFTDEHEFSSNFIPFVNIANNQYISTTDMKKVIVYPNEKQNKVKKNDLFFLMSSETHQDIGKSALLKTDVLDTYLNSFCRGFRFTRKDIVANFVNYLLASEKWRNNISAEGKGFTRINLKIEKINDLLLMVPPYEEEKAIADYLDTKTAQIDRIMESINTQIEKLKELRKTLINDVVTGKIKVYQEGE